MACGDNIQNGWTGYRHAVAFLFATAVAASCRSGSADMDSPNGRWPSQQSASSADVNAPAPPPPDWVAKTPLRAGQMCARGAIDPTFYRLDQRDGAARIARNQLARDLELEVTGIVQNVESARGSRVDPYIVSEVTSFVDEAVLTGAEIVSYWHDASGQISAREMTYALACVGTDESLERLTEKLKNAYPDPTDAATVAAVRDQAKTVFERLEEVGKKAGAD